MTSIKERLIDEGYGSDELFMPEELDKGFVGIAQTDWHYGRPVYDISKLEDVEIPETPEGMKEPIFFTPGFNEDDYDCIITLSPSKLNDAIIGVTDENQVVYEYESLLNAMMEAEGWDEEEAADFISYNTFRDYSYRNQGPIVYESVEYLIGPEEEYKL